MLLPLETLKTNVKPEPLIAVKIDKFRAIINELIVE